MLYDVAALADDGRWPVDRAARGLRPRRLDGLRDRPHHRHARRPPHRRVPRLLARGAGRHRPPRPAVQLERPLPGLRAVRQPAAREGLLDVIVATGDQYDYLFEDDDDPAGGGNAAFMRRSLLGQAPGPDFPDVEELRVPIFMIPGNHDYRMHPYKLIFDLAPRQAPRRGLTSRTSAATTCGWDDALALVDRPRRAADGDDVARTAEVDPDGAARMLAVDPEIRPYNQLPGRPGVLRGRAREHRIVMLDSGADVGVVRTVGDGLRTYAREHRARTSTPSSAARRTARACRRRAAG